MCVCEKESVFLRRENQGTKESTNDRERPRETIGRKKVGEKPDKCVRAPYS